MVNFARFLMVILGFCLGAGFVGYANHSGTTPGTGSPESGQDIMSVDRRVTTLEQHMYTLDANLGQLQQQIMMLNRTSAQPTGAGAEVQQLRLELDLLRSKMTEVACALAKLDERTLAAGKPKGRTGVKDPCRLETQTPIEITGHPY